MQPFDDQVGQFVLLALNNKRVTRIARQYRVVELGDQFSGWSVPELERLRHEATRNDLVDQTKIRQHFQRRGMRGGSARRFVDHGVRLEDPDRDALARQGKCGNDADRATAGDENRKFVHGLRRSAYCSFTPAILTASAQNGISAAIRAANSAGVLPSGSTPR